MPYERYQSFLKSKKETRDVTAVKDIKTFKETKENYHIPSFIYRYFSCIYNDLFFDGIDTFLPFKLNELQNKGRFFNHRKLLQKNPIFWKFFLLLSMPFYCYTSCQPSELTIAAFRNTRKNRQYASCQFWKLNRSFASYLKKVIWRCYVSCKLSEMTAVAFRHNLKCYISVNNQSRRPYLLNLNM